MSEKSGNVNPEELARLCGKVADDRKAGDVMILDVSKFSTVADYFVLCTGNSEPHLKAIGNRIGREVKDQFSVRPRTVEGTPASQWILLDFVTVLVHIMTPDMRELYNLESLWGDAPSLEAFKAVEEKAAAKQA